MMQMAPTKSTRNGEVRIVDSRNFPVAAKIAMAHVTIKPGGMRELHWHPNADEWQYYIKGKGRMTLFFNKASARTADFNPGDVGYAPRTFGHYVETRAMKIWCSWRCSDRRFTRTFRSTSGSRTFRRNLSPSISEFPRKPWT